MGQLKELSRPFPDSLIKAPPRGKYGRYVPHVTVCEKLLATLGPFSFEVTELIRGTAPAIGGKVEDDTGGEFYKPDKYPVREGAVVGVRARLTAEVDGRMVTVEEIGTEDSPAMHHDGENAKNAASDALKRCAMRLGCGLHLWHKTPSDYNLYRVLAHREERNGTEE